MAKSIAKKIISTKAMVLRNAIQVHKSDYLAKHDHKLHQGSYIIARYRLLKTIQQCYLSSHSIFPCIRINLINNLRTLKLHRSSGTLTQRISETFSVMAL